MNSMRRQKDRILKDELCRSVGAQYTTEDQWRNNSRKNEEIEPQQKQPVVDMTGDGERVRGRKARGLQTEDKGCKCQTFWSLLSSRRKQTSNMFFLLYTNLKGGFS